MIMSERYRYMRLTGRVRFCEVDERLSLFATTRRIALVVEEQGERALYSSPPRTEADLTFVPVTRWRNATSLDLSSSALRWLVDGEPDNAAAGDAMAEALMNYQRDGGRVVLA